MFNILISSIEIMIPLLLAATGGLFTEIGGTLNIALEGLMIMGACFSYIGAALSGSLIVGLIIGILSSVALALLITRTNRLLHTNIFIAALAANMLSPGLAAVISFRLFQNKGILTFSQVPSLPLWHYPFIGDHSPFLLITIILLFLSYIIIEKTPFGIHLKASGIDSDALRSYGINPDNTREIAFIISALFCGLAGSVLSFELGSYIPGITAGKGWIALVIIYLGGRNIFGILPSAFLFALAETLSNNLQGFSFLPGDIVNSLPNIFTLIVLIGVSIYTKKKTSFKTTRDTHDTHH